MPITRKVVTIGNSKGVTLPSSWLRCAAEEIGEPVRQIAFEINGKLVLSPYKPKEQPKKETEKQ